MHGKNTVQLLTCAVRKLYGCHIPDTQNSIDKTAVRSLLQLHFSTSPKGGTIALQFSHVLGAKNGRQDKAVAG